MRRSGHFLRRSTVISLLASALAGSLASAANGVSTTPTTQSPTSFTIAVGQRFVTAVSTSSTDHSLRQETQAGPNFGIQRYAYTCRGAVQHDVTELIDDTIYEKGSAVDLECLLGISSREAQPFSNRWFKILRNNPAFHCNAFGITISSFMSQFIIENPRAATS